MDLSFELGQMGMRVLEENLVVSKAVVRQTDIHPKHFISRTTIADKELCTSSNRLRKLLFREAVKNLAYDLDTILCFELVKAGVQVDSELEIREGLNSKRAPWTDRHMIFPQGYKPQSMGFRAHLFDGVPVIGFQRENVLLKSHSNRVDFTSYENTQIRTSTLNDLTVSFSLQELSDKFELKTRMAFEVEVIDPEAVFYKKVGDPNG